MSAQRPNLAERIADSYAIKVGGLSDLETLALIDVSRVELTSSPELQQVLQTLRWLAKEINPSFGQGWATVQEAIAILDSLTKKT